MRGNVNLIENTIRALTGERLGWQNVTARMTTLGDIEAIGTKDGRLVRAVGSTLSEILISAESAESISLAPA
jgi:hypothetical protein